MDPTTLISIVTFVIGETVVVLGALLKLVIEVTSIKKDVEWLKEKANET